MTSEFIPRASLDSFHPGLVDAELKSLKLLSRRLQSSLTILGAELQLLRRLYYKNKNQHRGALFWRNVSELQRYLHKLEDLNLQDSIITLRNAFYGTTAASSSSMKGTWTHCPGRRYLSKIAAQYHVATQLLNKVDNIQNAFLAMVLTSVSIHSYPKSV
ncbi:hypothetical protein HYPSUDRAFT_43305 [Hypholoma sublateritium FD-334 SS-4]|uniref:RNase MRP protein 1 RNA binding domain-containing protein n=1 Tax=Hypholoma sublateritium (strain FD-334 SS-4) TaxID=945553 RepID=A0A0D2MA48_HYPSF|nr:hypothetical protein HYPSUDRAFT_43305 [Hypholoma sublateritium FD-334 SS-4]